MIRRGFTAEIPCPLPRPRARAAAAFDPECTVDAARAAGGDPTAMAMHCAGRRPAWVPRPALLLGQGRRQGRRPRQMYPGSRPTCQSRSLLRLAH
jgi:hypothetical protein